MVKPDIETVGDILKSLPPPKAAPDRRPMTLVEKLEHVTEMARRDPVNKAEVRWRLQYIVDELHDWPSASIIDALCKMEPSHPSNRSD
jgi:hypothetical protein